MHVGRLCVLTNHEVGSLLPKYPTLPRPQEASRAYRLTHNQMICWLGFWGISSAGRAIALQAIGREFEPHILHLKK